MATFIVMTTKVQHCKYVIEADSKKEAESIACSGGEAPQVSYVFSEDVDKTVEDSSNDCSI